MKTDTPEANLEPEEDIRPEPEHLVQDQMGVMEDEGEVCRRVFEKFVAPRNPRLASIVREIEAAVRELEEG